MSPNTRVRATVNLDGVRVGEIVRVDPSDPYFVDLLREGLIVLVDEPAASTDVGETAPDDDEPS